MIYEVTIIVSIEANDPEDAHDKLAQVMDNATFTDIKGYTIDEVDGNQ